MIAAAPRFTELIELGLGVKEDYHGEQLGEWYLPGVHKIGPSCPKLQRLVLPSRMFSPFPVFGQCVKECSPQC